MLARATLFVFYMRRVGKLDVITTHHASLCSGFMFLDILHPCCATYYVDNHERLYTPQLTPENEAVCSHMQLRGVALPVVGSRELQGNIARPISVSLR